VLVIHPFILKKVPEVVFFLNIDATDSKDNLELI
jgi:hypothetical protein